MKLKWSLCSSIAEYIRTGTFTNPNEIAPVQSALGMDALTHLLYDLRAERVEVARAAAGHEAVVDHDLLVHPVRAGVLQVGLDARVGGELAPLHDPGLHERPRPVADRAHRLAGLDERAHERHRV